MPILAHCSKTLTFSPFDVSFIPSSSRIAFLGQNSTGRGIIQIHQFEGREITLNHEVEKKTAFKCATFGFSDLRQMASGDFEGKLAIWDLERLELPIFSIKAHESIINCIDGCHSAGSKQGRPEIVTGSRDGTLRVWDIRQDSGPVVSIDRAEGDPVRDCWAVAFGEAFSVEDRSICAGFSNGDLSYFDLRNMSIRWNKNYKNTGICSVELASYEKENDPILWGGVEGKYGLAPTSPNNTRISEKEFLSIKATNNTIWKAKHLPQNKKHALLADGQGSVHLLQTEKGEIKESLKIAKHPLPSFGWSPDLEGLFVAIDFNRLTHIGFVADLQACVFVVH